jgi:septal ring factor EnvC (AmiA/AmiB activator)
MKTIKKYWKLIVGAIVALFGLIFVISRKSTARKLDKTDKELDDNNKTIDYISGKLERIKEEEKVAKEHVQKLKKELIVATKKKNDIVTEKRTTEKAKENILKKIRK